MVKSAVTACICFDFDGTLVKSMDAAFNAFERVGPELGCKSFTRDALLAMRGLHVRDVIREMGIPFYRVPRLATRMRKAMRTELMQTPPVAGMAETLELLAGQGHRLGILSSNAPDSVREYVALHGLTGFSFIVGGASLLKKQSALRTLLRRQRLRPDELIYVGDEVRDIEAARAAGIRCAAVVWGYNSAHRLALEAPDYLIEHPSELLKLTRFKRHQLEESAKL